MNTLLKKHRIEIALASGVVLSLALGRCSPISPSTLKHITKIDGNSAKAASAPEAAAPVKSVFVYKTKVLEGEALASALNEAHPQKIITLSSSELSDQFEELRKTGKTEIQLKNWVPEKAIGYFEVTMPERDFLLYDLNDFDTILEPIENGRWSLSVIENSSTRRISRRVLRNLVSVALVFEGGQELAPAPAPSTSPNPKNR